MDNSINRWLDYLSKRQRARRTNPRPPERVPPFKTNFPADSSGRERLPPAPLCVSHSSLSSLNGGRAADPSPSPGIRAAASCDRAGGSLSDRTFNANQLPYLPHDHDPKSNRKIADPSTLAEEIEGRGYSQNRMSVKCEIIIIMKERTSFFCKVDEIPTLHPTIRYGFWERRYQNRNPWKLERE